MNELQIVLLGIAVLAVAGIYWQARRRSNQQAVWRERPKETQMPLFDDDVGVGKPRRAGGRREPSVANEPAISNMPPGILAVALHQVDGVPLDPYVLHPTLESVGLSYGEFGYYHKRAADGSNLYSVGSITKPGTLNPDEADALRTPGLIFYMELDNLGDRAYAVLDDVIATAESLGSKFDAQLVDNDRQPLTIEGLEALRDSVRTSALD